VPQTETALSDRMKTECWPLHQAAETAERPKRMLKGDIGRDLYIALLEQMLIAMRALDDAIADLRPTVPALAAVVTDDQLQAPAIEADLDHFGADPSAITPLPATRRLVETIRADAADRPIRLLGLHYVREGANNGNVFLAKTLRTSLGLPADGSGTRHLDPYGADNQRPRWMAL